MSNAAIMVAPYDFILRTTAAATLIFKKDEEKFVPALVVSEARKRGAKVVRFVDGDAVILNLKNDNGVVPDPFIADQDVNEDLEHEKSAAETLAAETLAFSDQEENAKELPDTKTIHYTKRELQLRSAIEKVAAEVREGGEYGDYFVESTGYPKVSKLQKHVTGSVVTSQERDIVFDKMQADGFEVATGD